MPGVGFVTVSDSRLIIVLQFKREFREKRRGIKVFVEEYTIQVHQFCFTGIKFSAILTLLSIP